MQAIEGNGRVAVGTMLADDVEVVVAGLVEVGGGAHVDSLVPWKATRVRASGGGDHRRTTDAEEGLSPCMLFLVFVRGGRKVHGRHVVDGERTLAVVRARQWLLGWKLCLRDAFR